jgi:predicted GTPase
MLGVLTHIDLLRPVLEWSPPYDWREPNREKERSIAEAIDYIKQLFPGAFVDVIAVCADAARKRSWGVIEELVPTLTTMLNEAQSTALLRAFEQELDQGQMKTLLKQVQRVGSDLLRAWIEERLQPTNLDKKSG